MELDERIEALEKELASIKGNLRTTLEQIKDTLSQRARPVSEPSMPEEQARTEGAPVQKKSDPPKSVSKRPKRDRKPSAEHPGAGEAGVARPGAGHEHVASTLSRASTEPPSPSAAPPPHLDKKLADLGPGELESILDMYVSMGYLPAHTRRLVTRLLNPTKARSDKAGLSLWDCITALAGNDDSDME